MGNCFYSQPFIKSCPKLEECELWTPTGGWCVKVYDGDTFTIAVYLEKKWTHWQVRINGIDCPEIRTKDLNEKCIAQKAKDYVSERILSKWVLLKNCKRDKYGRLLADVYLRNENIGEQLLHKHLAVEYDGGTKIVPLDWNEYYTTTECRLNEN